MRQILLLLLLSQAAVAQYEAVAPPDAEAAMPSVPWTNLAELERSKFGESAGADGVQVERYELLSGKYVRGCRGAGVRTRDGANIVGCRLDNNFIDLVVGSSDCIVTSVIASGARDACVWIVGGSANQQISNVHAYGALVPVYNEGGRGARFAACTFADGYVGYLGDTKGGGSNQCAIDDGYFQNCLVRSIVARAGNLHVANTTINVPRECVGEDGQRYDRFNHPSDKHYTPALPTYEGTAGVELEGYEHLFAHDTVELTQAKHNSAHKFTGRAAIAFRLNCKTTTIVDCKVIDNDGVDGSIAFYVPPGDHPGLTIEIDAPRGFHESEDRLLVIDAKANCPNLKATFTVDAQVRDLREYVRIDGTFTGRVRVVDRSGKAAWEEIRK